MLVEVKQSKAFSHGLSQLADTVRRVRAGDGFNHPLTAELSARSNCAPALYFDISVIEKRMQWLGETAAKLSISALVAVKSCPELRYLEAGKQYLNGFDVSNLAEYQCLPDDLDGKLVSVTSPDMHEDLSRFISKGNAAVIVLDTQAQLDHYFAQQLHIPYLLRVQGSELVAKADPAYYPASRFGFTVEQVKDVLSQPGVSANPPSGFHVHHGSEKNTPSTYRSIIMGLTMLAHQLPVESGYINLGGGWHELNQEEISAVLSDARRELPEHFSIIVEPGQWYGQGAGFAVGTIVNQVVSGDMVQFVLNISNECHLRWSDVNLVYRTRAAGQKFCEVQFYGSTCYEADRIGKFLLPYEDDFCLESGLSMGSTVVFSGVATYSAAWNTSFNGIPQAQVNWWSSRS